MTANTLTVHLWNPIVGSQLHTTLGDGDVHVHVPVSLAAGVAMDCGTENAAKFLELIIRAARQHVSCPIDGIELSDALISVIEGLDWRRRSSLKVNVHADLEPSSSMVKVTAEEPLPPLELPGFPDFRPQAGWSSKSENLWQPIRFTDKLPAVVTARAGGRPGWSGSRGLDIAADPLTDSNIRNNRHSGWPHIVIQTEDETVRLEAEWDLRDRTFGHVIVLKLRPITQDEGERQSGPEWSVGREWISTESRVVVTAGNYQLRQLGDDRWSVNGPQTDVTFDDLMAAMEALDEKIDSATHIDYLNSLEELQDESMNAEETRLFPSAANGLWNVGDDLWVPATAEDLWVDVFETVGVYGARGYYVYLYRWQDHFLLNHDEPEDHHKEWEVLGRIPLEEAVAEAQAYSDSFDDARSLYIDEDDEDDAGDD